MTEHHAGEAHLGDRADLDEHLGAPLDRLLHQAIERRERRLGLAVREDDVPEIFPNRIGSTSSSTWATPASASASASDAATSPPSGRR